MPGIAGIISKGAPFAARAGVDTMLATMMHETDYRTGSIGDDRFGFAAGWVVRAGGFDDCMPAWNAARDVCIIFSGEDLQDPAVTASATRLVAQYEAEGLALLPKLNGMFSGLIVDLREKKLTLFNDRMGMNRIYWHEDREGFYFASEAKALLRLLPATRSLSSAGVGEFISGGCVLGNRTLFTGIELMPGGSAWSFTPGGALTRKRYFDAAEWENLPTLGEQAYYEELSAVWKRILPRYFRGGEGTALSLTGGVDSRLIIACAPVARGKLKTYTFTAPYRDPADLTVGREFARLSGQPHEAIELNDGFLDHFGPHVEKSVYMTDGTLDPTGAADLYVNRIAKRMAPVRVTGLNGGEILRRLVMFKPWYPVDGLLQPEFLPNLKAAEQTFQRESQGHRLSFIAFKQSPWHIYPRLALERSQLTLRSPYFDNDLLKLAYQAGPGSLSSAPALRIIADANPGLGKLGTDRATLLRSIPGVTAIRHGVQEFTFKAEYAYDYGMPQWLTRVDGWFKPLHLEKLWLGRHKFYHFRIWYRDRFAAYLKDVLLDSRARSRPYLDGAKLQQIVLDHTAARGNYTLELHRFLTLELAQRTLIEAAQQAIDKAA
jgi:asparagine synthase (glutamine-hydrolysing)